MEDEHVSSANVYLESLKPHSYPRLFYIIAISLVLPLIHFALQLPAYYALRQEIISAEDALKHKDFYRAICCFDYLKNRFPECRRFRVGYIQACFADGYTHSAVRELKKLSLTEREWKEVREYLPKELLDKLNEEEST